MDHFELVSEYKPTGDQPQAIKELFDEKIGSIYQTIVNNYQQIDSLTKQRDELLPLLMNGQVSVNSDLSHN